MKLCTNCKHENTDMNEWPCSMCDDIGYGPNKWEVKDDNKEMKVWHIQTNFVQIIICKQ